MLVVLYRVLTGESNLITISIAFTPIKSEWCRANDAKTIHLAFAYLFMRRYTHTFNLNQFRQCLRV